MLQSVNTVILFGDRDDWSSDEEDRLLDYEVNLIVASPDGPAHPLRTGRLIVVSTYTLNGLRDALRSSEHERPLDPSRTDLRAIQSPPLGLSVLVAEDNPANRCLIADQLELLGCDAFVTDSGQSALEAFDNGTFDVILTDLDMPGMSGHQLAQEVRGRGVSLPIVAITAHVSNKTHAQAIDSGMTQVMTKPISISTLRDVLQSLSSPRGGTVGHSPHFLPQRARSRPQEVQAVFLASFHTDMEQLVQAHEVCDIPAMRRSELPLKFRLPRGRV